MAYDKNKNTADMSEQELNEIVNPPLSDRPIIPLDLTTTTEGLERKIARTRQNARMWELRVEGYSIEQIADIFTMTPNQVKARLRKAAEAFQVEAAEDLIKMELDRLDMLLREAINILNSTHIAQSHGRVLLDPSTNLPMTDHEPVMKAMDRVLKIMDRRSKYLGLDAPSKSEQSINVFQTTQADLELQEMIREANARTNTITPQTIDNLFTANDNDSKEGTQQQ